MNSEDNSSNEWKTVIKGKKKNQIQIKDDPMKTFFLKIKKELDQEFSYLKKKKSIKNINNLSKEYIENTTNIFSLLKGDSD